MGRYDQSWQNSVIQFHLFYGTSKHYSPIFVFEYLGQENMLKLLEQALEKTFEFEFTESDGLGIVHTLIEIHQ